VAAANGKEEAVVHAEDGNHFTTRRRYSEISRSRGRPCALWLGSLNSMRGTSGSATVFEIFPTTAIELFTSSVLPMTLPKSRPFLRL